MDPIPILLVLGSATLHAGWNLLHHRSDDRLATIAFAYFIGGFVLLPVAVLDPPTKVIGWIAVSILFHMSYQYLLSGAFARGGLSVTYPIARGVSPLLVALGGWWLLDERPSTTTLLGIVLVSAGLMTLAKLGKELMQLNAVGFAAITGVTIAGYSLIDAHAVSLAGPVSYFSVTACGAGLMLILIARIDLGRIRKVWRVGAVVGSAQTGGYILILFAFQRAQAAQVASLRQVSVIIGVLAAAEMARRKALFSAVFIAAGSILLAS